MTNADLLRLCEDLWEALDCVGHPELLLRLREDYEIVQRALVSRAAVLFARGPTPGVWYVADSPGPVTTLVSVNPMLDRLHWLVANPDAVIPHSAFTQATNKAEVVRGMLKRALAKFERVAPRLAEALRAGIVQRRDVLRFEDSGHTARIQTYGR